MKIISCCNSIMRKKKETIVLQMTIKQMSKMMKMVLIMSKLGTMMIFVTLL